MDLLASVVYGGFHWLLGWFVYQAGGHADGAWDEGGEAGAIAIFLGGGGEGGRAGVCWSLLVEGGFYWLLGLFAYQASGHADGPGTKEEKLEPSQYF